MLQLQLFLPTHLYISVHVGNRCQIQQKDINQYAISLIGTQHYGEHSFPSALYLLHNDLYSGQTHYIFEELSNYSGSDYESASLGDT